MTDAARAFGPSTGSPRMAAPMPIRFASPGLMFGEGSVPRREAARALRRRALLLWPRLDASRLSRTGGDPWRIARLVAARTPRSLDEIVAMLTHAAPACPIVPTRSRRAVTVDGPSPSQR